MLRTRSCSFLLALLPCGACATMATPAGVSRSVSGSGPVAVSSVSPERRVFVTQLTTLRDGPGVEPIVVSTEAWGTVRLVLRDDDSFEYLATIYNPSGEAFTAATLRRVEFDDAAPAVATLFSGVTFRSPYLQLRGTVSLPRQTRAALLAEELREHPRAFAIRVYTANGPRRGVLSGVVE